jgi:hypothetical protein
MMYARLIPLSSAKMWKSTPARNTVTVLESFAFSTMKNTGISNKPTRMASMRKFIYISKRKCFFEASEIHSQCHAILQEVQDIDPNAIQKVRKHAITDVSSMTYSMTSKTMKN